MSELKDRLADAIEKTGEMKKTIAEMSGISPQQLNHYLSGFREPKLKTAEKLAAATGVHVMWLLYGLDQPAADESLRLKKEGMKVAAAPFPIDRIFTLETLSERGDMMLPYSLDVGTVRYTVDPRAKVNDGDTALVEVKKEKLIGKVAIQKAWVIVMPLDRGGAKRYKRRDAKMSKITWRSEKL